MKQFILTLVTVAFLLTACNNNTKKVEATSEDGKTTVSAEVSQMQQASEEMKKQSEELQKLPPLSLDELKALLPEQLMTAKRTNFQTTSVTGAGLAHAEYKLNDSTELELNIYDCGGPGGAGIYNMQYMGMLNIQSESEDEYTKTIDFRGGKAFEHCDKPNNHCTITYFTGKRFLVTIEGHNVHPDGLKQAAGELKI